MQRQSGSRDTIDSYHSEDRQNHNIHQEVISSLLNEDRQNHNIHQEVISSLSNEDRQNHEPDSEVLLDNNIVTTIEREEFRGIRQEQQGRQVRLQIKIQREGQEVFDLEHQLQKWVGVCA